MIIIQILICIFVGILGGIFLYGLVLGIHPEDFIGRVIQYCVAIFLLVVNAIAVGSKETDFYYTIIFFFTFISGIAIIYYIAKEDNKEWIYTKCYRK